jgi:hypothetical protein
MTTVAEMPKGVGSVAPAVLEKRAQYDGFVNGLTDGQVLQFEPDTDETIREIMVSLTKAAVRVGKEVVTGSDGSKAYVRLANADEASKKIAARTKAAKAKASTNGNSPVADAPVNNSKG